jgi:hypothetical protein
MHNITSPQRGLLITVASKNAVPPPISAPLIAPSLARVRVPSRTSRRVSANVSVAAGLNGRERRSSRMTALSNVADCTVPTRTGS